MKKSVLVISNNPFSKDSNNGKTLEAIYQYHTKDRLSQLFFTGNKLDVDFDFCSNYLRISDVDVLRRLFGFRVEFENLDKAENVHSDGNIQLNLLKSVFFSFRSASFFRLVRDLLWSTNVWKTKELISWVRNINPDYIFYVSGGSNFTFNVARYISDELSIPIVSFFTDDYLIYPLRRNIFDKIIHRRIKKFSSTLIDKSILCFGIGSLMCQVYSEYFNKEFYPLMNSVPIRDFDPNKHQSGKNTISYFGSLHTQRWRMLMRLASIVNLKQRNDIIIKVYTSKPPERKVFNEMIKAGITFSGSVFGDDLVEAMKDSDILLHIESNDEFSKSLTKLSVSTKIPEYLISSRPILGFGPTDVASMMLLVDEKIGLVLSSDNSDEEISIQLNNFLNNKEYQDLLAQRGYSYAINNFNSKINAERFSAIIASTLN